MSGREEGEIIDTPEEGPVLRFIKLTPRAYAPEKMTEGSAGYDLKSPRTGAILPQRKLTLQTDLTLILPTLFFNISSCRQHAQKLLSLIFAVHRQV